MELDPSSLRQPAALAAFRGWNDAGEAASSVVTHLVRHHDAEVLLAFDEGYYDLKQTRPLVVTKPGGTRELQWPKTVVMLCRTAQRDLLVIIGDEPNFDWVDFCHEILTTVMHHHATPLVVLGAMNSDEPHTRPLPVSVDATNPDLVWGLGAEEANYTGPTGITGVLSHLAADEGVDTVSMWASVPYYGPDGECPKATLALARRVSEVLGVDFDFATLEKAADTWQENVTQLVEADADLSQYVRSLEQNYDDQLTATSGEDLAAQIEKYLWEGGKGSGSGSAS
ncbi:PAC2 family protein [Propionibacteriaceae bacterium G1746]|uniref:PAC2 family protein n=1 Tax=Aestuariimicrobium sp. G57 TaxID=3418485 RepID=UPI003C1C0282